MTPRRWLSVRQAAEQLGTTPKGFYAFAKRHDIPSARYGNRLRFDSRLIDALPDQIRMQREIDRRTA